jgi:hypothetical protein
MTLVGGVFWYQDWQYSLPTPRPPGLRQPALGISIMLAPEVVPHLGGSRKPVFLHFFSANCPCSRFNLDHVRSLIRRFRDQAVFVAVIEAEDPAKGRSTVQELNLGIPAVFDTTERIAARYGVYSTPQAVILDAVGNLYYRGNYNVSRYCTDARTEYARLALEALLAGRPPSRPPEAAAVAYGCQLPRQKRGTVAALLER